MDSTAEFVGVDLREELVERLHADHPAIWTIEFARRRRGTPRYVTGTEFSE